MATDDELCGEAAAAADLLLRIALIGFYTAGTTQAHAKTL